MCLYKFLFHIPFLLLFLIGCSPQPETVLNIGVVGDMEPELDVYADNSNMLILRSFMHDTMVDLDEEGELILDAFSVQSTDSLVWEIAKQKSILNHQGDEITIDDVLFSLKLALEDKGVGNISNLIQSIKKVDSNTIHVTLSKLFPDFDYLLQRIQVLNQKQFSELEDLTKPLDQIVGVGPYQFLNLRDRSITVQAFPDYFDGKPQIPKIQFHFYENSNKMWNDIATGKLDLINALWLDSERIQTIESIDHLQLHEYLFNYCYALMFNCKVGFFSDSQIRRAFDQYLNKKSLVRTALHNKGIVAESTLQFVPNGSKCESMGQVKPPEQTFLQLLQSIGYKYNENKVLLNPQNQPVVLKTLIDQKNNLTRLSISSVQEQLLEIGIDLEILEYDPNLFSEELLNETGFDIVYFYFRCGINPDFNRLFWHSNSIENAFNFWGYSNPNLDQALDRGYLAQTEEERIKAYTDFIREFRLDPPASLLYYRKNYAITSNRLHNYHPHSLDWTPNPHVWKFQ